MCYWLLIGYFNFGGLLLGLPWNSVQSCRVRIPISINASQSVSVSLSVSASLVTAFSLPLPLSASVQSNNSIVSPPDWSRYMWMQRSKHSCSCNVLIISNIYEHAVAAEDDDPYIPMNTATNSTYIENIAPNKGSLCKSAWHLGYRMPLACPPESSPTMQTNGFMELLIK